MVIPYTEIARRTTLAAFPCLTLVLGGIDALRILPVERARVNITGAVPSSGNFAHHDRVFHDAFEAFRTRFVRLGHLSQRFTFANSTAVLFVKPPKVVLLVLRGPTPLLNLVNPA